MTDQSQELNHISTVRRHLLDQMQALRGAATPEAIERELGRSKGVSELAQAVVNTAKVEVDYLKATGQTGAPFLGSPEAKPALTGSTAAGGTGSTAAGGTVTQTPGPGNGIRSITRHAMGG